MSKYSKELCESFPDMEAVKRATRDVIKRGGELAFKEYHDASSYERLKREVMR